MSSNSEGRQGEPGKGGQRRRAGRPGRSARRRLHEAVLPGPAGAGGLDGQARPSIARRSWPLYQKVDAGRRRLARRHAQGRQDARCSAATRSSPFFTEQLSIVLANSGIVDPGAHRILHRGGRLPGAARRAARNDARRRSWTRSIKSGCAGAAARAIPTGLKWGTVAKTDERAEIRHLQRRRRRSRRVHGPQRAGERSAQRARRHGHRRLRGRRQPGLHLRARGVSAGDQPAANRHQAGQAAGLAGQRHLRIALQLQHRSAHRRRRVRLRRGDGADGLGRRQTRHAASASAVPGGKRLVGLPDADQQRRDVRQRGARSSAKARTGLPASAPRRARARRCSRSPARSPTPA